MLSLQDALRSSTHLSIRWRHREILRPTCDFLQTHLQESEFFWFTSNAFQKRRISSCWDSYVKFLPGGLRAKVIPERTTYCVTWGVPRRVPSSVSASRLRSDASKSPQEPWRSRWPWERDNEQSGLTNTHHTHCASRQLGTTADQRYDVPWDWLQDAHQMARVHWGTRCKGFCSKESPHYRSERSARNQLERNQVQRALVKLSRSCHQTSNNQPWFTTWKIPWGFLAWAVLHWLSVGLCHARKFQFEEFCVRRKGMIRELPTDVCMRNLRQKAERETGSNSCTRFPRASCFKKTHHVCQKNGGACTTWYSENQRYKKTGWEIGFPCSQERYKKTSK